MYELDTYAAIAKILGATAIIGGAMLGDTHYLVLVRL